MTKAKYKKRKELKLIIKAIPIKETGGNYILRSGQIATRDPYTIPIDMWPMLRMMKTRGYR